jgi:5-hydroxyisourate hydrolase-like protein (transthyretin family)
LLTDQDGRYAANVWAGSAHISITASPSAYAKDQPQRSIFIVNGQTTTLDPITLLPGLSVVGKVVREDGKPAGGIAVFVYRAGNTNEEADTEQETTSDGSYSISGLSLGSYIVSVPAFGNLLEPLEWVPSLPLTFTTSQAGPVKVPDILLTRGTFVTGTVVDAVTKMPVPNVVVEIQDPTPGDTQPRYVSATTDQDGRFTARVWTGTLELYVHTVPKPYVVTQPTTSKSFDVKDRTPITLDPIELIHGLTLAGTVIDQTGNVVPNLVLKMHKTYVGNDDWINVQLVTTTVDGKFIVPHLLPGTYTVDAGADWTVVSPSTIDVSSNGKIKLVLKQSLSTALQGTVVDTSGEPLAGAVLVFGTNPSQPEGSSGGGTVIATTNSDGFFTIPNAHFEPGTIQSPTVTKDGYLYQSGGDITPKGNQINISVVVMARLGGTINGIVRNGLNAPVAGAWVTCPYGIGDIRPIQTGPAGRFSFSDLTIGPVIVYASKGSYYGEVSEQAVETPTDLITVTLSPMPAPPPASDLVGGTQMLTKVYSDFEASGEHMPARWILDLCAQILASASLNASLSFIESHSGLTTSDLQQIVPEQALQNPAAASQWGVPLIQRAKHDGQEGSVAVSLGVVVAPFDMNAAVSLYNIATKSISIVDLNEGNSADAAKLVALAYATKRPDADTMYQTILSEMKQAEADETAHNSSTADPDWPMQTLATNIALGNVPLAKQLLASMSESSRVSTTTGIVQELAALNPSGALDVFHTLDAEKDPVNGNGTYEQALCQVLPTLFASKPADAVDLAKKDASPEDRCQALVAVADLLPLTLATPLYRQAEDEAVDQEGSIATPAAIAARALLRDKSLGSELFQKAFDKVIAAPADDNSNDPTATFAEFAFYYSQLDPAYSRMLLEGLFRKDMSSVPAQPVSFPAAAVDATAMSAIDPERALEMAASLKDPDDRMATDLMVAYFVLQSQKTRDILPFDLSSGGIEWISNIPDHW